MIDIHLITAAAHDAFQQLTVIAACLTAVATVAGVVATFMSVRSERRSKAIEESEHDRVEDARAMHEEHEGWRALLDESARERERLSRELEATRERLRSTEQKLDATEEQLREAVEQIKHLSSRLADMQKRLGLDRRQRPHRPRPGGNRQTPPDAD